MANLKPTDTAKYDRQLRLWGEEGQALLESTHVCLLNATATGTETLKNLVLPGIGHFTIVDGKKIDNSDFNNFFITEGSQGKSRAQVTTDLLKELNDRVQGSAVDKDPVQLINQEPDYFKQFTVIIANDIPEEPLRKLAQVCWNNGISLVVMKYWGFVGYLRLVANEHTIVESKPDNPQDDLRISNPFPELVQYAEKFDLSKMDSTEHSHTPYVIILLQNLAKWKAEHEGKAPQSYAEKSAFKDQVIRGARKSEEENFSEAHKAAHKAYSPVSIPSGTQAVLNDPKAVHVTGESSNFWLLAAAVREFVHHEGAGLLPLMGSIPDMTASTDGYIALQNLYQEKAARDIEAVRSHLSAILEKVGKAKDSISAEEVKKFCKNAHFLQVIRYRSLEEEYNPKTAKSAFIASQLTEKDSNLVWYMLLRAADRFYSKHNRYPGDTDAHVTGDLAELTAALKELLQELNITETIEDKYVEEMIRFGGAELHPIAALLGGVASQEVIKLATHQFSPTDNTFIFNGLKSTSSTISL